MEVLGLFDISTFFLACVTVLITLYWYYRTYFCYLDQYGYKGPRPLPFLGTIWTAFKWDLMDLELRLYKEYKDQRVCRTFAFNTPFIAVFDTDLMKEILVKRFNDFPNRLSFDFQSPEFERGLTALQDDHWKHIRQIITPTFTSGKLKNMMKMVREASNSFVESMAEKSTKGEYVNLKDATGAFTMDVIASTMFGLQVDSQKDPDDPFVKNAKNVLKLSFTSWKFMFILMFPSGGRLLKKFGLYLMNKDVTDFFADVVDRVMAERKKEKQKNADFLQLMVDEEVPEDAVNRETTIFTGTIWKWSADGILRSEILANAILFFLAGYDTSATTLALLSYNLAMNPDIQDKVIAEIDEELSGQEVTYDSVQKLTYLDMALSESLRLYPPIVRFDRVPNKDVTIDGITFPAGTSVGFPVYSLQRDPEIWPEPDKFDPERFTPEAKAARNPFYYMPFGWGQRQCVGMRLALLEIKVVLATFYSKYKFVKCDKTTEKPKFELTGLIQLKTPLFLKVEPRD